MVSAPARGTGKTLYVANIQALTKSCFYTPKKNLVTFGHLFQYLVTFGHRPFAKFSHMHYPKETFGGVIGFDFQNTYFCKDNVTYRI